MTSKVLVTIAFVSGWAFFLLLFFSSRDVIMQRSTNDEAPAYLSIPDQTKQVLNTVNTGTHSPNPIPKQEELIKMSDAQLELLYHTYVSSPQATCSSVVRMGKIIDGGWEVCLDPRYAPDPSNCLVYSFGINDEFSFDDAMEKYGCEVHSFDPSMGRTKEHLRGKSIHFHPEGISNKDGQIFETSKTRVPWKLNTLGRFRQRFGHAVEQRKIDVLKMDVEGFEKKVLPEALRSGSTADIPQICFEMHQQAHKDMYLKHLEILRESYDRGLRIFMTNRNRMCLFTSKYTGMRRTRCHEVYTVNITLARQIV